MPPNVSNIMYLNKKASKQSNLYYYKNVLVFSNRNDQHFRHMAVQMQFQAYFPKNDCLSATSSAAGTYKDAICYKISFLFIFKPIYL